jgi:hemerythrin-like metal-binding protein
MKRRAQYLQHLTEEHFSTEEDLMLRYAITGQDEHRAEHNELLRQLNDFFPNHDEHGLTIMTHSCKDWLIPHIQKMDADLVDRLKAAGVTSAKN